jgi:hypothetical protein
MLLVALSKSLCFSTALLRSIQRLKVSHNRQMPIGVVSCSANPRNETFMWPYHTRSIDEILEIILGVARPDFDPRRDETLCQRSVVFHSTLSCQERRTQCLILISIVVKIRVMARSPLYSHRRTVLADPINGSHERQ